MKGTIIGYKGSHHTMHGNQMIVEVEGVKKKADANKLVGKKATFKTSGGKKIIGKIASTHGNGAAVRVRFRKGLPGQAIGQKIEIAE